MWKRAEATQNRDMQLRKKVRAALGTNSGMCQAALIYAKGHNVTYSVFEH